MDRAPRDLGADGRRAWRRALASAPWIAAPADRDLLRVYCALFDERGALERTIAETGRLASGSKGQDVTSPAAEQLRGIEDRIWKAAAALGLGPASRKRLTGRLDLDRGRPALAPVVDLYAALEAEA